MNNIHLTILKSSTFSNVLNELEFNNILNPMRKLNDDSKKISVKILFAESIKMTELKKYLLENEPIL